MIRWLALFVATAGFVGVLPYRLVPFQKWKGSGFLGSLVGLAFAWLLGPSSALYAALGAVVLIASVPASGAAEKILGSHDDPRIVIDEVAGMWIAAWGMPGTWVALLLAFFFFRLFDVLKGPWGNWAARAPGGWGVVADDVLAGVLANLCVRVLI